jgi:hypothetical protein
MIKTFAGTGTKTFVATVALLVLVSPLFGTSYYPKRLNDPKAVYLSSEDFPVRGDGVADDSAAIQQAINKVQEERQQGIVFVPAGRYRVTKTIYIWPGIRLIGFGAQRPTFVLAANTLGFQQAPRTCFSSRAGDHPEMPLRRMRALARSIRQ